MLLTAVWTLWGACWLRRVELRRDKAALVRTLGLEWVREGLGPSVRARGHLGGQTVEARWRRGVARDRVRLRRGAVPWLTLGSDDELRALLASPEAPSPEAPVSEAPVSEA